LEKGNQGILTTKIWALCFKA